MNDNERFKFTDRQLLDAIREVNPTVEELAQRNCQLIANVQKLSKEVYGALEFLWAIKLALLMFMTVAFLLIPSSIGRDFEVRTPVVILWLLSFIMFGVIYLVESKSGYWKLDKSLKWGFVQAKRKQAFRAELVVNTVTKL
jgi:hypothetical protein